MEINQNYINIINFKNNNKHGEKSSVGASLGATIKGLGMGMLVPEVCVALPCMEIINKNLPSDTVDLFHQKGQECLQVMGLDKKVGIKYLEPDMRFRLDKLSQLFTWLGLNDIAKGDNACFAPSKIEMGLISGKEHIFKIDGNNILLPKRKMSWSVFHEAGHAMNFNLSKTGKGLQYCRAFSMFAPVFLILFAAFGKPMRSEEKGNISILDKIINKIRDNVGKITFAAMMPMVIEEGMASYKGQKVANKILDINLANLVKKNNTFAFMTYLSSAVFMGLGAYVAKKSKDKHS